MINKALHRKIKQHEPLLKLGVNSGSSEGWPVPVLPVSPVFLKLDCLPFFDLRLLITLLVSSKIC
jgi:hypothetical protein